MSYLLDHPEMNDELYPGPPEWTSERPCEHEDKDYKMTICGPEWFCLDCGADLDADGPLEDPWD